MVCTRQKRNGGTMASDVTTGKEQGTSGRARGAGGGVKDDRAEGIDGRLGDRYVEYGGKLPTLHTPHGKPSRRSGIRGAPPLY